jgi:hypothetical protein
VNKNDLSRIPDDELQQLIAEAVAEFGRRRYDAGLAAMRESILRAAQAPAPAPPAKIVLDLNKPPKERAPRGAVAAAVEALLKDIPDGALVTELEAQAAVRFPDIATKSIGNELRRGEDRRYRRDRPGGYRWFLIADGDQESPGPDAQSSDPDSELFE